MENMEEKIMEVLGDPEKMEQIIGLAKGLGFSPAQNDVPAQEPDAQAAGTLLNLMQLANTADDRQQTLLQALMPYLKPSRQKKLQKAMRVAKLSHLAEFALKNYSDKL